MMSVTTGTSNQTWRIDRTCVDHWRERHHIEPPNADKPCHYSEMLHYDKWPTGFIWCDTHCCNVGFIVEPPGAP